MERYGEMVPIIYSYFALFVYSIVKKIFRSKNIYHTLAAVDKCHNAHYSKEEQMGHIYICGE